MRKMTTDQRAALDRLAELLPAGTTVWTKVEHVSRSGMSRSITAYVMSEDTNGRPYPLDLTYWIARAGLFKSDQQHGGVKLGGVGMDMGFHLVYSLSRALFANGHKCTGYDRTRKLRSGRVELRCPSNDHTNDYGRLARQYDAEHADGHLLMTGPSTREERSAYVSARQDWISAQPTYSKRRRHADGGYALNQAWL